MNIARLLCFLAIAATTTATTSFAQQPEMSTEEREMIQRGIKMVDNEDYDDAITLFKSRAQLYPKNQYSHTRLPTRMTC